MYRPYSSKKVSSFAERFSELCESNPSSDSTIADHLNVSKQTISAWKSGARSPKPITVMVIAHYFNVNDEWLNGYDVPREPQHMQSYIGYGTETFPNAIKDVAYSNEPFPPRKRVENADAKAIVTPNIPVSAELDPEEKLILFKAIGKIAKKDQKSAAIIMSALSDNDII